MEQKADDLEVISIMVNGGERICDEAIAKWTSGKYGNDADFVQENVMRWEANRRRIRELAKVLKNASR